MITVKLKKSFFAVVGIAISIYFLFTAPYAVSAGVTDGLKICFYTVIPSLFPFMVLSSYVVKSDVLSPVYKVIAPLTRFIFHQPPCAAPVIIMSLIGGFPVGAKMTASLLEGGQITKNQAQRLNMFCINGGPAFVITAVGAFMLSSVRAGVIMYASLCISSLIIGVISSFFDDKSAVVTHVKKLSQSPLAALSSAVSDAVQSILGICAWIVIFGALTSCIEVYTANKDLFTALSCILEVTDGCALIAGKLPIAALTAVIGFGGICVHCQIFSYVAVSGLKYSRFFTGRAVNAALSALICHLLLTVFPVEVSTAANVQSVTDISFSVSIPAFLAMTVMCIIMIFDIDAKRKLW